MTISCPVCHQDNRDNAKFCAHCGENFAAYTPCPSCHALSKSTKFCTSCGQKMEAAVQVPVADEKIPALSDVASVSPAAEAATLPERVAQALERAPTPLPDKVATPLASEPTTAPVPADAAHEPLLERSPEPEAKMKNLTGNAEGGTPQSNLKLIISGALGAVLLVVGGYWFVTQKKTAEPSLATTTSAPSSAAPTPSVAVPQLAVSEPPKAESEAPPAIANPTTIAEPTLTQPVVTAPAPAPASTVKPNVVVPPMKTAAVKKKSAESPAHDVVKTEPLKSVAAAPPVVAEPPPPPKPVVRSIDEQFSSRAAAECAKDFTWLICREKIRFSVCDGKWSENPPAGQSICKGVATKNGSH